MGTKEDWSQDFTTIGSIRFDIAVSLGASQAYGL